MKNITTCLIVCICMQLTSLAQTKSVGIGGAPDASAQLDIKSTTGGLLLPKLNTNQRVALPLGTSGLIAYDTDTKTLWYSGNNKWNQLNAPLPYSINLNSNTPLSNIVNTSSSSQTALVLTSTASDGLRASSNGTYSAIFGQNNSNGKGVTGHNTANGIGVYARGVDGTALFADIPSGYGDAGRLKQINPGGKALDVQGNVRIYGGNNAEGVGKYYTCGNNGDGFWTMAQSGRIHVGFSASDFPTNGLGTIPNNTWSKYHPRFLDYNISSSFKGPSSSPASTFICPINGFYKFDATLTFDFDYNNGGLTEYVRKNGLRLMLKRNGSTSTIAENIRDYYPERLQQQCNLSIENHVHLEAGDEVWLEFMQAREYIGGIGSPSTISFDLVSYFGGHILWADAQ